MTKASFSCIVILALLLMVSPQISLSQSTGQDLYKSKCQACHGPDSSGDTVMGKKLGAKDLRSAEIQKQSDAEIATSILKGKDKMKGFEGKLTFEQVHYLVAYLRELAKKK